jgi:L-amino acid N-acyltransferase
MILIRPAEERDLAEILEIYNHSILNTASVYSYKPHTMEMRKKWFEDRRAANQPVFVAETAPQPPKRGKKEIAGFVSYGPFRIWPAYKYTVEHSVHVHVDYRRQGVAKLLLAKIIESAKINEMHAIIGGIDAANTASIHLHEQFNFKEVAHFKEVGYKFNTWRDLKFYELVLETPAHPIEG